MATIRLIPSAYTLSSTSYLSVSNASNMYSNTDDTTYATVTNSRTNTTSYYIYLHDFNFSDIPSNAIINSFSVKLKAYESGVSTSTTYRPYLVANGNTSTSVTSGDTYGYCNALSTSATTQTFTILGEWADIVAEGNDLSIRINCRRASKNTTSYVYIYGAEIDVDYTLPVSATVTSTLNGNGTISPSGAYSTYEDTEYILTITPTNKSDTVTIVNNGTDVTSQLVAHGTETTANRVLGAFTLESGSFNGSGESYFEGIVGNGVDASKATSNYYSGGSSVQAVFTYDMSFSLPSNANITRVWCEVNGHAESTSNESEYMCVQLKSGSIDLSEQINFKSISTSNTTITLEADTLPTVSQISSMVLECTLGYYGGAINGATCYVEYDIGSGTIDHYTYTFTVTGDATIAVTIGSTATNTLYLKINGTWTEVSEVYVKTNGAWVKQSDVTNIFNSSTKYVKGVI